jgi:succinate dehydrogenase/fumarate reductase flavoprotein subunit
MTRIPTRRPAGSRPAVAVTLSADVVVVGGGPAATWAALGAAEADADVVLANKGSCGTSGPTASGGTGFWYVEPAPAAREAAMASREGLGGYLADRAWMARVLDQTYENMHRLGTEGRLSPALAVLDQASARLRVGLGGDNGDPVPTRQAAAMVAHARWVYTSALARTESRGMHKREDHPAADPAQWHRLVVGGLDEVRVRTDQVRPALVMAS